MKQFFSHLCCESQFREREQGDLPLRIKFGENCWCFEMFKCHFGVKISQSLLWYKVYTQICKYKVPERPISNLRNTVWYIQQWSSLFDDQQSASLSACGGFTKSNDQQSAPPPGSDDHSNVEMANAGLRLPPRMPASNNSKGRRWTEDTPRPSFLNFRQNKQNNKHKY